MNEAGVEEHRGTGASIDFGQVSDDDQRSEGQAAAERPERRLTGRALCQGDSCDDGSARSRDRVSVSRRSTVESVSFAGYRCPPEVILLAVRWYLR